MLALESRICAENKYRIDISFLTKARNIDTHGLKHYRYVQQASFNCSSNGTTGVRLPILHCHNSLRCGCCASWPVMLCITPRLWKMTRSPSLHRCAYTVDGEHARRCKSRHMRLTSARPEIVVTAPVAGSRVCSACTQQPAICRLGSAVEGLRQTIYRRARQ